MPWHKAPEDRQRDARRYGATWRRARDAHLRKVRWRCEIRGEGCRGAATEVDHIDGADNDPHHRNLRAACSTCHGKVTAQQGGGFRKAPAADPQPRPRTSWT